MERTLIICGSAGRGGTTEAMCQAAAEEIRRQGYDALVVFPSEMEIRHCTGCDACADGPCVLEDDMGRLYRLFSESDFLIMATPLHFNGPSSLLKTVMDRFQVYWRNSGLDHPLAMLGFICAGSDSPNFEPTRAIMRAFAVTTGIQWLGDVCVSGTDRNGDAGVDELVSRRMREIIESGECRSRFVTCPQTSCGDQ